jgi:hypothetical protein
MPRLKPKGFFLTNDNAFQAVEQDDLTRVGPRAILICGFSTASEAAVRELLGWVNAPDVPLIFCAEALLTLPLVEALTNVDAGPPVPPDKLPPVMVLSGLTGQEIHGFLEHFAATNLPRPIFAAATPTNLTFTVKQLLAALRQERKAMPQ